MTDQERSTGIVKPAFVDNRHGDTLARTRSRKACSDGRSKTERAQGQAARSRTMSLLHS